MKSSVSLLFSGKTTEDTHLLLIRLTFSIQVTAGEEIKSTFSEGHLSSWTPNRFDSYVSFQHPATSRTDSLIKRYHTSHHAPKRILKDLCTANGTERNRSIIRYAFSLLQNIATVLEFGFSSKIRLGYVVIWLLGSCRGVVSHC